MICARLVNGIGTGILNSIVPVWATETAEHTSRGQFIAIEFTLNIFGVAVAYWLEFGLSFIDGGRGAFQWRFPIAVSPISNMLLCCTDPNLDSSKSSPCSCCLALSGSSLNLLEYVSDHLGM